MKVKIINVIILVSIFSMLQCKGQKNKTNNQFFKDKTTEMETAKYIYENYDYLNFDDNKEELIEWDLNHDTINLYIKEHYKNEKELEFKLEKLEELRERFYLYAIQNVKTDYEKYNFTDGPYFNYLLEKNDESVKTIILEILKRYNKLTVYQRKEIDNLLLNLELYIQDPDGYTNLRKEKSKNSEIIQQLKNGEKIEVINNEGNWCQIKTKEGKEGYVYYDRIKIK